MHITIVTLGSRGDVQPFIALGMGLKRAGYEIRFATYDAFANLVERCGLEFAHIEGDPRQAMEAQSGQRWMESGESMAKFIRRMRDLDTYESLTRALNDTVEACRGTDAILYTPLGAAGYHVAEYMNIPALYLLVQPISRSREVPIMFAPNLPLGGIYNRLTYFAGEQMLWQMARVPFNRWRRETLKLKPIPFSGPFDRIYRDRNPFIYGFSRFVVPPASDWPNWHHVTGYWFLENDQEWSPPPELLDFLAEEPKPIYIGFGSMSGSIAQHLLRLSVEAVEISGQRAILLGGWAAAPDLDLPDSIYTIDSAPHDWLFPRVTAVVHHGGAGTTAAGLRAGRPSVIIPFFGDQPYWGQRVHALGTGPQPIMRSALTANRLADAINQAATDQAMRSWAAELGEHISAEDGIARAVEIINQYIG